MTTTVKGGSVVVGVDGSVGGDAALEWAVRHAVSRRRPLLVVNGAGDPSHSAQFIGVTEARQLFEVEARRVTDHALLVARRIAPDIDIEVSTPLQDARDALLDLSAQASILVVGTRGRGPVRALLLGSVSTAVAGHATCPVAVVRPAERDSDENKGTVVVGTDGGPASSAALEFAFELAATESKPLHVVHSWSALDTFIDPSSYAQRVQQMEEHKRIFAEALAGYGEKCPDVPVTQHMPDAGAVQTLVEMSQDAAVVVIGSRGRTGLKAMLTSVSRDVVERAHSTVVVVRP